MTIGKGTLWGRPGLMSLDSQLFDTDAALAEYLGDHLGDDPKGPIDVPPIVVTGGALWNTIGGPSSVGRYATSEARHYPCDLAVVVADGARHVFVASLVARNRWWTKVAIVMNAQDIGAYRFGHRAHPGDALLDIYEARISFGDVFKIAKRAKLGSHLPHPGIAERRMPSVSFTFEQSRDLWLDERAIGKVKQLTVTVVPDAFTAVV
jgi:hypothetical protein